MNQPLITWCFVSPSPPSLRREISILFGAWSHIPGPVVGPTMCILVISIYHSRLLIRLPLCVKSLGWCWMMMVVDYMLRSREDDEEAHSIIDVSFRSGEWRTLIAKLTIINRVLSSLWSGLPLSLSLSLYVDPPVLNVVGLLYIIICWEKCPLLVFFFVTRELLEFSSVRPPCCSCCLMDALIDSQLRSWV